MSNFLGGTVSRKSASRSIRSVFTFSLLSLLIGSLTGLLGAQVWPFDVDDVVVAYELHDAPHDPVAQPVEQRFRRQVAGEDRWAHFAVTTPDDLVQPVLYPARPAVLFAPHLLSAQV